MNNETLVTLTADIVSAYASHNSVGSEVLPNLIKRVYDSLALATTGEVVEEEKLEPAVSIRASLKHDQITCLDCGFKGKMLKRHIGAEHGYTPEEYRERWGLPANYPLVAPEYAARRSELVKVIGLKRKPG